MLPPLWVEPPTLAPTPVGGTHIACFHCDGPNLSHNEPFLYTVSLWDFSGHSNKSLR